VKYVKSRSAWFCSPPQHGRSSRSPCAILIWLGGTLRGRPPLPRFRTIQVCPQGLAGRSATRLSVP
jgi:hypothetical protein